MTDQPSSHAARADGRFSRTETAGLVVAVLIAVTALVVGIVFAVAVGNGNADDEYRVPPGATAPDELDESLPPGDVGASAAGIAELPDPAWIEDTSVATGIPERALRAYAGATLSVQQTHPDCNLAWNTLAAIGFVESHHGGIFGARITDDGDLTEPVIGIALDGGEGVAAIPDTDDGELDGDTTWDRAVGPMQFIPQTWERFGVDGNGDGVADPQNIDDAALSAAHYLCTDDRDLSDATTWIQAVASYNVGVDYNNKIVDAANTYARAPS